MAPDHRRGPGPSASAAGPRITVRTGSGTGRTRLSAFDRALGEAGVADYNLVTLSSVIPERSAVVRADESLAGRHGDRLWCVLAQASAEQHGEVVWAGLGWAIDRRTAGGVFVEHRSGSEDALRAKIALSLEDMCAARGWEDVELGDAIASARCVDDPVCALAIAVYEVQGWASHD